eukprot:SAG31_NODE_467_length_15267_cov_13.792919_8_plen_94_part_00
MPYLWDPNHSTSQLAELVTKDPQQFQQFSVLPLMAAQSSVSLGAILYAKPLITPLALVCLYLYKHTRVPFGWGIRSVCQTVCQTICRNDLPDA